MSAPTGVASPSPATPEHPEPVGGLAAVAVLVTTSVSALLVFGSASALSVAIPSMSSELSGGVSSASWMILAFLLGNAATILFFGKLSDLLGRRPFYLGGLVAFTLASVVCATVDVDGVLIAARIVQGLSAASAVANSTAVLSDVFEAKRLPIALGLNVTVGGASTLLGPLLGGLLLEDHSWRAIFVATIPLGVVAIATGWRTLGHAHSPDRSAAGGFRLDVPGALLSIAGIGAVLYGAQLLGSDPGAASVAMTLPLAVGLLAAGAITLLAFVLVERRVREPILDFRILTDGRGLVYLSALFISFAFGAALVLVVLYLQTVEGATPLDAGAAAVPMGIALVIASLTAGFLGRRISPVLLTVVGGGVVALAMSAVAVIIALRADPVWLSIVLPGVGLGEGMFMAAITRRIMDGVAPDRRAIANGFRSVMHNGALSLSTAAVLGIVTAFAGAAALAGEGGGAGIDRTGFVVAAVLLAVSGTLGAVTAAIRVRPRV